MNIANIHSNDYGSNTYVVSVASDGVVLVDAGVKCEDIRRAIGDRRVMAVLITHTHFDHILHLDEYLLAFGHPRVYIGQTGVAKLHDALKNMSAQFLGRGLTMLERCDICVVGDDDEIILGDVTVAIRAVPGHSDCSVAYIVDRNIFSGDVVFCNGLGRTDLFDSDYAEIIKSIRTIKSYDGYTIHPGHDEAFVYNQRKG